MNMKMQSSLIRSIFYGGYIFLYLPLVLIIFYSFNASETVQWQSFSLHWYRVLFHNTYLVQATLTSIKIAFLSATFSTIIGTACAVIKNASRVKLYVVASIPLLVPEVVMGLSSLMLFVELKKWGWLHNHFFMMVATHTTLGAAYATEIIKNRLDNLDPQLEEASMNLGASKSKTFLLVILPLIFPSIFASWMIAFLLSFDDVILSSFTSGPGITTLPLFIFSSIKLGHTPQINALAACIVLITAPLILIMSSIYKKSNKKFLS
jgi:putrescine transport system permease protein